MLGAVPLPAGHHENLLLVLVLVLLLLLLLIVLGTGAVWARHDLDVGGKRDALLA